MNICYKEDGHNVMPGDKEVEAQSSEMIYSKLQTNAQQSQDERLDISVTIKGPAFRVTALQRPLSSDSCVKQ